MTTEVATLRIVVPCRNADGTLADCLAAICRSRGIDAEIVVVNDGTTTVGGVPGGRTRMSLVSTGGGIGAGAARNTGARGFRGSALVFVDADVVVASPETIATLVEPVLRKEAEATVGCYAPSTSGSVFAAYKQLYLAYTYGSDTGELRNTFWTALCAVNSTWFDALGGFKECYTGAGPEDVEFGIALTGRKGRIRAVPAAQGFHRSPMTFWKLLGNDLRKGSEDVYVHWVRRIPLTDNRHVGAADIGAVASAGALLLLLCLQSRLGALPSVLCGIVYLSLRGKLLRSAFWRGDIPFFLLSVPLTYLLDIVRAGAVIAGTALAGLEIISMGRVRPFLKG